MTSNVKILVLAVAIGAGAIAQTAVADDTAKPAAEETAKASSIKIPAVGGTLLNDVRHARMALFDGQAETASGILSQATSYLGDDTAKYAIKTDGGYAIPVDSGVSFADGFTPTQDHAPAIAQAGQHMQQGDIDGAIETMTNAGVDLDVKMVVVPYKTTVDALEKAIEDIGAGDIHKANMVLKSIETSVKVDDFKPGHLPHQGYKLSEILGG